MCPGSHSWISDTVRVIYTSYLTFLTHTLQIIYAFINKLSTSKLLFRYENPRIAEDLDALLAAEHFRAILDGLGADDLIIVDQVFLHLGYKGDAAQQRRTARKHLKGRRYAFIEMSTRALVGMEEVNGQRIANPLPKGHVVLGGGNPVSVLMTARETSRLFITADTPHSDALGRGLIAFFGLFN